jgi:hypothetical protein
MSAIKRFQAIAKNLEPGLMLWDDAIGIGFHSDPPMNYEGEYFRKYQDLDSQPMGANLTAAREALVSSEGTGDPWGFVVDIGIGGGRFVTDTPAMGFDINPDAVAWLKSKNLFVDVYAMEKLASLCFWDSLEHIPNPSILLDKVCLGGYVYMSIPIFDGLAGCVKSKHYKPGEHLWYFTQKGLIDFMLAHGFAHVSYNFAETELGREGITSFVFQKLIEV